MASWRPPRKGFGTRTGEGKRGMDVDRHLKRPNAYGEPESIHYSIQSLGHVQYAVDKTFERPCIQLIAPILKLASSMDDTREKSLLASLHYLTKVP